MKTLTLEFQEEISLEQCNMIYKLLEAVNLKVKTPQKVENPFNYDLERMKDRVENQTFHTMPTDIKNFEEFDEWMTKVATA